MKGEATYLVLASYDGSLSSSETGYTIPEVELLKSLTILSKPNPSGGSVLWIILMLLAMLAIFERRYCQFSGGGRKSAPILTWYDTLAGSRSF
jgi:hypothetical protein